MNYIELNNETKNSISGNVKLIENNDFDFNGAEFFSISIASKEVFFKILNKSKKIFEFKMKDANIIDFELTKEKSLFSDDEFISSILFAIEGKKIYSVAISIKGGRDFRFMCDELELVSVKDF